MIVIMICRIDEQPIIFLCPFPGRNSIGDRVVPALHLNGEAWGGSGMSKVVPCGMLRMSKCINVSLGLLEMWDSATQ